MHPMAYLSFPLLFMSNFTVSQIAYHRGKVINADAEKFRSTWSKLYRRYPLEVSHDNEIIDLDECESIDDDVDGAIPPNTPEKKKVDTKLGSIEASRYMIAFLKSCRDPKVHMGHFYTYGKTTATTFTTYIVEYTVWLLVTF